MILNLIKVAIRNFRKNKSSSLINVIGLSVGLACFFLITVNVQDEFSYDNFHENKDRIYRVALERIYPDNVVNYAFIPSGIGHAMKTDFPEIEDMTRVFKMQGEVVFQYEDKSFEEKNLCFAEPNFFKVFSIPLIEGDPDSVFPNPNSLVITKETAAKYFGDEEAVGKQITTPQGEFMVTGVCELPKNSHIGFDFLGTLELIGFDRNPDYVSFSVYTYVLLKEGVSPEVIEQKMPALVEQYAAGQIQAETGTSFEAYTRAGNGYNYFLQPIQDIHLKSHLTNEIKPNGNILYVYIMIAIAVFVIIIACINFMNLATAQSSTRAREVGIRKIIGSTRGPLVRQFLIESILTGLVSTFLAAVLIQMFLPVFNQLQNKQLEISFIKNPLNLVILLCIGLAVGTLAGIYPSFFLSSYNPATILRGRFARSQKGVRLRNALVVFQFILSIVLISMTMIVFRQIDFMQNKDLGFEEDNRIVVERAFSLGNQLEAFKQEIKGISGVVNAGASNTLIQGGYYYGVMLKGQLDPEVKTTRGMTIDDDFTETMGIEVLEGRDFSKEFNDEWNVIINQAAIREFGWDNPIGMKLSRLGGENDIPGDYTIIGVVEDFHYNSLHEDIDSFVFFTLPETFIRENNQQEFFPYLNVKVRPDNISATLSSLEQKWNEFNSQEPFSSFFLNEKLNDLYSNEKTSGQIFTIFSVLAIIIACIGLFGLSAYMTEQRTKEIGIRKALGSTSSQIVILLSKDFARLLSLAFLISVPVGYFIMTKWLHNFAYRISPGILVPVITLFITFSIAFLSVSFKAVKAALSDPADSLRYE